MINQKKQQSLSLLAENLNLAIYFLSSPELWKEAMDLLLNHGMDKEFPFFHSTMQSISEIFQKAKEADETTADIFRSTLNNLKAVHAFVCEIIGGSPHRPLAPEESGELWVAIIKDMEYASETTPKKAIREQKERFYKELEELEARMKRIANNASLFSMTEKKAKKRLKTIFDGYPFEIFISFKEALSEQCKKIILSRDALKKRSLVHFLLYLEKEGGWIKKTQDKYVKAYLAKVWLTVSQAQNQEAFRNSLQTNGQKIAFDNLLKNNSMTVALAPTLITDEKDGIHFQGLCKQAIIFFLFIMEVKKLANELEKAIRCYRQNGLFYIFEDQELTDTFDRGVEKYQQKIMMLSQPEAADFLLMGILDEEALPAPQSSSLPRPASPVFSSASSFSNSSGSLEDLLVSEEDDDLLGRTKSVTPSLI